MAIKFLVDHRVDGPPVEAFKQGDLVKDRSPESELGFVRRRVAAFVGDKGALTDHEGLPVVATNEGETVIIPAKPDRRDEGPRSDGTPPRALAGPRTVVTSVASGDVEKAPAKGAAKATAPKRSRAKSAKGKSTAKKAPAPKAAQASK
ncbi:hypothetical protein ACWPMX_07815 [Tsuneonella sp. HG094]